MSQLVRKDTKARIVGTLERLAGRADIASARRDEEGTIELEYAGDTEIWWDEQKTVHRGGRPVYIDEDGEEVTEDNVVLAEESGDTEPVTPAVTVSRDVTPSHAEAPTGFDGVLAAMQYAEEIGGCEEGDYVDLMTRIAAEANQRIENFRAAQS